MECVDLLMVLMVVVNVYLPSSKADSHFCDVICNPSIFETLQFSFTSSFSFRASSGSDVNIHTLWVWSDRQLLNPETKNRHWALSIWPFSSGMFSFYLPTCQSFMCCLSTCSSPINAKKVNSLNSSDSYVGLWRNYLILCCSCASPSPSMSSSSSTSGSVRCPLPETLASTPDSGYSYDSKVDKDPLHMRHGCVKGLQDWM